MAAARKAIIQLFANIVKVFGYVYHFFCPKKRFTIPACAPARKKAAYGQKIPRVIWQTNFIDKVTLPVYLNYLFNRWMAPAYEHRFVSTEGRGEFIKANYPGRIYDCYSRLQIGAAQADFWRVLVLQKCGGVYIDINATLIYSMDKFIGPEDSEAFLYYERENGLSNFFIASKPDNPNLAKIIDKITQNIEENTATCVFVMTGPGVLNTVLDLGNIKKVSYKRSCFKGAFTNEYFQYIDKPQGKWHKEQKKISIVKPKE